MASFNFKADLMALIGAQYVNMKARPRGAGESDESYAKVPFLSGIFVPDKFNDIEVRPDTSDEAFRNKSGYTAPVRLSLFPLSAEKEGDRDFKLVSSIKARLAEDGKEITRYNVPSHKVVVSYGEDFRKQMRSRIASKLIAQHPEWAGTTEDGNKDLRSAVNREMPYDLGLAYLREPKQPQQQVAPQAVAEAVPVADEQQMPFDPFAAPGEAVVDDLPF